MANRPLATPEHYGGPGFDPLEYSPSHLPGDLDPVPNVTNPGTNILEMLISVGVTALFCWAMGKLEGSSDE